LGLILVLVYLGSVVFSPVQASPAGPVQPVAQAGGAENEELVVEGRLVPVFHASLSTQDSGQAEEVLVQEGDQVEAGSVSCAWQPPAARRRYCSRRV
jgi:multidrug efflux pump subunit AcrA (membrane-fusion protein)